MQPAVRTPCRGERRAEGSLGLPSVERKVLAVAEWSSNEGSSAARYASVRFRDLRGGRSEPGEEKGFRNPVSYNHLALCELGGSGSLPTRCNPVGGAGLVVRTTSVDSHRLRCPPLPVSRLRTRIRWGTRQPRRHVELQWRSRSRITGPDRLIDPHFRA